MIIFPAIDIKDGKVVRLKQGKFDAVTKYSESPLDTAWHWINKGAEWLHVIDLDGAREGHPVNTAVIHRMIQELNVKVQAGGGIRKLENIAELVDLGIHRIILGTSAVEDQEFLIKALERWPDKIAVSLDCSGGKIALHGWTKITDLKAVDYAKELEDRGLKYLIYTDIQRDGMLTGPHITGLKELLEATDLRIIASGGISNIGDIKKLKGLEPQGLIGAITGKAIYEETLKLEDALSLCSQNG